MIRRGVILVALKRLLILAPFEVNAVSLAKLRALLDGPPGKNTRGSSGSARPTPPA